MICFAPLLSGPAPAGSLATDGTADISGRNLTVTGLYLYLGLIAATATQGYLLTCLAMVVARSIRLLDWPDKNRKLHRRPTPLMGGVAVMLTLILGILECHWLNLADFSEHATGSSFLWGLLLSASLLCLVGVWDDKFGMRASRKFTLQILAILPFMALGRPTAILSILGWTLEPNWVSAGLILLWLVSCTNFVNLVDGLDGLAGTVSLIASLTVAVLSWNNHLTTPFYIALVLSGSLLGFLIQNWHPAKIFLGDSGSLPLGFLIGALSLEASLKKAAGLTLVVPVVLLGVPIFDTSMAILRRKLTGRKIGQGDREHIHHCLRNRGLTPAQTVAAISAMCAATAGSAILASLLDSELVAVGMCAALLVVLVAGRVFGFNEFMLLAHTLRVVWGFIRNLPRGLNTRLLVARLTNGVGTGKIDLWQQMTRRCERLHGVSLKFVCTDPSTNQTVLCLHWVRDSQASLAANKIWELHYAYPRANGLMATITARGELHPQRSAQRLMELTEMFAAFCPNFPLPLPGGEDCFNRLEHPAEGGTTPIPEPHILHIPREVAGIFSIAGNAGEHTNHDAA